MKRKSIPERYAEWAMAQLDAFALIDEARSDAEIRDDVECVTRIAIRRAIAADRRKRKVRK